MSLSFVCSRNSSFPNNVKSLSDELLDFIELILIGLLGTLNFLEKFDFGVLSLLLDEVKLLLVEGAMVLERCLEVIFDYLELFWKTLDS